MTGFESRVEVKLGIYFRKCAWKGRKKKIKKIGKKRVKRSQLCCKSEKIRGQWGVLWL